MSASDVKCPVCLEKYIDPKILPCAHLLCRSCLVTWIDSRAEKDCPICRSAVFIDISSKSSHDIADSLPTDFATTALVESSNLLEQPRVCQAHTSIEAESLCLHCNVMLCHMCFGLHKTLPITSSHFVQDLATATLENVAANRQIPCPEHKDKVFELFCSTHDLPICQSCASSTHQKCTHVTKLSERIQAYKQSFLDMADQLRVGESDLRESITQADDFLLKFKEDTSVACEEINVTCDQLIESVEKRRKQMKSLLKDVEEEIRSAFQKRKSMLEQKRDRLTSHQLLIKRLQGTVVINVQSAMFTKIQDRINDLDYGTSLPSDTESISCGNVSINHETIANLETEVDKIFHLHFSTISVEDLIGWRFHTNHGTNIVLSNSGTTSEYKDISNGIVMSREPLKVNKVYEVRVDEVNNLYDGEELTIGVVTENPAKITLPQDAIWLHSAICIRKDHIYIYTKKTESVIGQTLKSVKVGSRIGVMLDAFRCLHLYTDGIDRGVFHMDTKQPCYAMIDFDLFLKKITTLRLTCENVL